MPNLQYKGSLNVQNTKHNVELSLLEFKEENVIIIYSPALDLSGYGYTEIEAKNSFTETLHEFIRYTSNKKTLPKVLESLGWSVKGSKSHPKFKQPTEPELISRNSMYGEILKTKDFIIKKENVELNYV